MKISAKLRMQERTKIDCARVDDLDISGRRGFRLNYCEQFFMPRMIVNDLEDSLSLP